MNSQFENRSNKPIVVAIGGGSSTGKSTLARTLAAELSELRPVILCQDHYFRDFAEYTPEERERVRTANHPSAVHWAAFHAALEALRAGGTTTEPVAGTRLKLRGAPTQTLGPTDLILVEGLFALWDELSREIADLRLFTETNDDERVIRRIYRDVIERGGDLERSIAWYRRDVKPNYPIYTASTRRYADLVIVTDHSTEVAVRVVCDAIRAMAARRNQRVLG